ncbi:DMBT1 protein, partial [Nothocercus nigrocapillus]|nr:DMBT1 protein [Nothocercus nigrocapillus]
HCVGTEITLSECEAQPWGVHNCGHGEDVSVVCSGAPNPDVILIRLVNGSNLCSGRVEVFHDQEWGTVCDDSWDLADAEVACRELGCGSALSAPTGAHFGKGSGHIWLDEVSCAGTEAALSLCRASSWGNHNCNHGEDASVECSGNSDSCPIRAVNGSSRCSGRVEVHHNQQWGTVCDDNWGFSDAEVVCRQLGCGMAISAPGNAHFGQGHNPIWLDEVNCTGTEGAITECGLKSWGAHNCDHAEDAGVVCSGKSNPMALRLVNGPSRCAGRLEVFHQHKWGTVCDDEWGISDAEVVCRQLGCGTAVSAPGLSHFGRGRGQIWLDEVNCTGTEAALSECRAKAKGVHNCHHGEDAGVVCSGSCYPTEVRLVNGSNRCSGRVEVLHNQQWGSVCDDDWDLDDAEVVCRQLGCGTAISAPPKAQFGLGYEPIWLDDVNCTGSETSLSECGARPWGESNCNHREDAGVVCVGKT